MGDALDGERLPASTTRDDMARVGAWAILRLVLVGAKLTKDPQCRPRTEQIRQGQGPTLTLNGQSSPDHSGQGMSAGRSVVASASALGAEDRRFESCRPDSPVGCNASRAELRV